jgi:hypothetical protein
MSSQAARLALMGAGGRGCSGAFPLKPATMEVYVRTHPVSNGAHDS